MQSNPETVVSDFCKAWARLDLDGVMGFFSDDAVYHNIPMKPASGKDAIRKTIEGLLKGVKSIEFKILHSATHGNVVMNERVDSFEAGGKHISLPVMGVFEIDGHGKIKAWRDYFDLEMYMKQLR
jgi:limonene-1,2-epoxide hydrolase